MVISARRGDVTRSSAWERALWERTSLQRASLWRSTHHAALST